MNQYLLIQNAGEAPVEGYTQLGFSSSRNVKQTIGQFGTGAKHGINLCLRAGLEVWVYCGTTRVEFSTKTVLIEDGTRDLEGQPNIIETQKVVYRVGQSKTFKDAGWVIEFGSLDWDYIGMGIREFVSNAIDRTIRGGLEMTAMSVKIVDACDRRAKVGTTRIFVEVNDQVREYFGQLHKRFLHFSSDEADLTLGAIPKADRNIEGKGAVIYREGVFVREMRGESLFDYNFSADQLRIDECRNSSEWDVKVACAKAIGKAPAAILERVVKAWTSGEEVFEAQLDADYMTDWGTLDDTHKAQWKEAWEITAGDAVVCDNRIAMDYVDRKGFKPAIVPTRCAETLKKVGIKTSSEVLDVDEQAGRTPLESTIYADQAVDWAWELFELANLTGEREKPPVACFQETMKADVRKSGYANDSGVFIHIDIANLGLNNELKKTALEEVAHWVTGATDKSRDFQSILLDALVTLA